MAPPPSAMLAAAPAVTGIHLLLYALQNMFNLNCFLFLFVGPSMAKVHIKLHAVIWVSCIQLLSEYIAL